MLQESKPNYKSSLDPYTGLIVAPTYRMLSQVTMKKFIQFAEPFIKEFNKSSMQITWHDGSIIIGASADRPSRIEGLKLNYGYIDEAAQCSEQIFLELKARTADSRGYIICSTSLGIQYINPKQTWVYRHFIENPTKDMFVSTWKTIDNPYIDSEEIEELKDTLDPTTFRQMFEISWDTTPKSAVYSDFCEFNILSNYSYNPNIETYVTIDFGWTHYMACLFIQYDRVSDTVYVFDEIVKSKMTLEELYNQIMARTYKINGWSCDIAGSQERELLGRSNLDFFKDRNIFFKIRSSGILYGISIVRSYILDSHGKRRLFVSESCKKTIDGLKRYQFPTKDGIITNEMPLKDDSDCVDSLRYFFVNYLDKRRTEPNLKIQRIR